MRQTIAQLSATTTTASLGRHCPSLCTALLRPYQNQAKKVLTCSATRRREQPCGNEHGFSLAD